MTPEKIRDWFKNQQKEHECCCCEWRYQDYPKDKTPVLFCWIVFEQLDAFTEFFGIIDDYTCPATIVANGLCINLADVASGYGFKMEDICPCRLESGVEPDQTAVTETQNVIAHLTAENESRITLIEQQGQAMNRMDETIKLQGRENDTLRAENEQLRQSRNMAVADLTKFCTKPVAPCYSCAKRCLLPSGSATLKFCNEWKWKGEDTCADCVRATVDEIQRAIFILEQSNSLLLANIDKLKECSELPHEAYDTIEECEAEYNAVCLAIHALQALLRTDGCGGEMCQPLAKVVSRTNIDCIHTINCEKIRERCEAATAGPWTWEQCGYLGEEENRFGNCDYVLGTALFRNDAEFIAHAREDILLLLNALDTAISDITINADPCQGLCWTCSNGDGTCESGGCVACDRYKYGGIETETK